MKYQELYDHASKHEFTIVDPETNVMPNKGWAIPLWTEGIAFLDGPENFDMNVSRILRAIGDYGQGDLLFIHNMDAGQVFVGPCRLYANQQYAMGYADGVGSGFIVDTFTGKKVVRK